jgi:hypothetical protein
MSTNTMTFQHVSIFDSVMGRVAERLADAFQMATTWFSKPQSHEPQTADELLALAAQYEATQPSYAADLRAVARRHMG